MVVECYGPVYRGHARSSSGCAPGSTPAAPSTTGRSSRRRPPGTLVAEWIFSCTSHGEAATFEGATIARLEGGKIAYLREYATSAPLCDWTGVWRD